MQQIDTTAVPAATTVAPKLIDLSSNHGIEDEVRETQLNKENTSFHFALKNVTYEIVRPHIDGYCMTNIRTCGTFGESVECRGQ